MDRLSSTLCAAAWLVFTPALAENSPSAGCSATPAAPSSTDGTAPSNAGSTGWSGGMGGSNIGTSQNGSTTGSKFTQPATARGLDPIAAAPKPVAAKC